MRILLSCLQGRTGHAIPRHEFWQRSFACGLREAGHEVLEVPDVDWAEGLTHVPGPQLKAWRVRTWEAVCAFVQRERRTAPVDLFLGYLFPQQIEPSAIRELQRTGIPCVNFFCDNVREFRRVPAEFACFSLHWVPEFEALPMYRAAGLPHIPAPMPCWVPMELRAPPTVESEPPTFIGSADNLRCDLLGRALLGGAHFVVRGLGWTQESERTPAPREDRSLARLAANQWNAVRTHGPGILLHKTARRFHPLRAPSIPRRNVGAAVSGDEYVRITREATVTLGVNRVPTALASERHPLKYSRLRDIEAPMLGACYLTEWTDGLGHMYELGEDIETFRTSEELGAKLVELCLNPQRRQRMRRRAQARAIAELGVPCSIARIAQRLGLPADAGSSRPAPR